MDAVVLSANDAGALNAWLGRHGYASNPDLVAWFKPYIDSKWVITAFKISKGESPTARAATSAVRMSFRTEKPFYPYREPPAKIHGPRALEVYFLSSERVQGSLGQAGNWPGQTLWAKPLAKDAYSELLKRTKLAGSTTIATPWLTRFFDRSSPRPGPDEVYFSRAQVQSAHMDEPGLRAESVRKASQKKTLVRSQSFSAKDPEFSAKDLEGLTLLEQGKLAEKAGYVRDAVRLYLRALRKGDYEAAKLLGDIFSEGKGDVPKDYEESLRYYSLAERNGVAIPVTRAR